MAAHWGRRETIVWQPHMPVYSYLAIAATIFCAVFFLWESYAFQQEPMRKAYTTEYIRATVGATANQHGSYRLLTLSGPAVATRLALPADFSEGTTLLPGGTSVPIMLSPAARAQGFDTFYRAPARTETPQKIFAHLLTFGPTPQQLVEWMSNPAEIDQRVEGTELASIIEPGAQQQRAGVLASLGLIADSLRMLPTKEQAQGRTWSATQWAEKRQGWIFITSKATEREALRPLHSLWIDLLVLRLLNAPTPEQRPVWFVLDELASLQRLPQLHTAITENRKSKNPLILGFQGKAQLEAIYGHLAEVMLSQPATKIFLKTTEPKAAEWVSKAIGTVEIERMRETHVHGTREGKSFSIDRQTEPLVMDSEIAGLPDKHAFLKLGNNVARFNFTYCSMAPIAADFEPRTVQDDELDFDPATLRPRRVHAQSAATLIPTEAVFAEDPEDGPAVIPATTPVATAAATPSCEPPTSPAEAQSDTLPFSPPEPAPVDLGHAAI